MTVVSFPTRAKYKGVYIDPHTPFEIDDADKDAIMRQGGHLISYTPDLVEDVVEEEFIEDVSDSTEPLPDGDGDESFDDEDDLVEEVKKPKPKTRRTTTK